MNAPLPPTNGARFELVREEANGKTARYAVIIQAAERTYSGELRIEASALTLTWKDTDVPEWIATQADGFVKTLARHQKDATDADWPRRLVRWRTNERAT